MSKWALTNTKLWALSTIWQTLLLTFLSGILIGGLTFLGQGILSGSFNQIANSGAVWVTVAFFLVSLATRQQLAIIAGTATLMGEVIGYYGLALFKYGLPDSYNYVVLWLIVGVIFGPLFGIAGMWWRSADFMRSIIAIAMLSATFIAEGMYYLSYTMYRRVLGVSLLDCSCFS
ncbi:MAG: hypothetical protein H0X24_13975 [Ktedonobacterales bacterium]|nr:hypothetical protein [Ktedonobacterales bacterium]